MPSQPPPDSDVDSRPGAAHGPAAAYRAVVEALEALDEGFSLWDRDDRLVLCNTHYRRLYPVVAPLLVPGVEFEAAVRYSVEHGEFDIPPQEREDWIRERVHRHREPPQVPFEQRHADGRWLLVSEHRTRDGGIVGIRVDITTRKRTETALARLNAIGSRPGLVLEERIQELLRLGAEQFSLAVGLVCSFDGEYFTVRHSVSPDVAHMLLPGTRFPAQGTLCGRAVSGGGRLEVIGEEASASSITELLPQARISAYLGTPFTVDGRIYGALCFFGDGRTTPFTESDHELMRLLAQWVSHEIERQEAMDALDRARAELERLAATDDLTGLLNRRALLDFGRSEFERARRYGHPLCVLVLDVDHFKLVNDTQGHAAGDRVLHEVAQCCRAGVRNVDGVGRVGGEEFVLVLIHTGERAGMEVGERIRTAVAHLDCGPGAHVTASLGVAELRDEDEDFEMLLARADAALYWAKERGRNRVCLAPG